VKKLKYKKYCTLNLCKECVYMERGPKMDYFEILKAAWEELKDGLAKGSFDPRTEADVKCFFYSCLTKKLETAKNIHAEFNNGKRKHTDLVIDNKVFIEINFILKSGAYAVGRRTPAVWDSRRTNANEEIARLTELKKRRPEIIPVLAIVAGDYDEKDNLDFYDGIERSCKKNGIVLLIAWKRRVGAYVC
jgi:hypothetical protein